MMKDNRIRGGLMGLVIGDALGLPVQFHSREARKENPVTDMMGYGTFDLPPGYWSDDSSLALCLTESIVESGFDPEDMGRRFLRWYTEGYWTPTGYAYDIGKSTARAMENLKRGVSALEAGPYGDRDNGNGSLMRILPASIFFHDANESLLADRIWKVSRITHGHPRACSACFIYSILVRDLLHGCSPYEAYRTLCTTDLSAGVAPQETQYFRRLLSGTIGSLPEDQIGSDGYVINTLEASVWCLLNNDTFEDTVLSAVNLGEDTDTTGAVAGGLAGIVYGYDNVPDDWLMALARREDIMHLVERFADKV